MEKQPPLLPVRLVRDHDNEDKASLVIRVRDNLNQLLESDPAIVNEESEESSEISIYKIPDFITETNRTAFEPQLVSFGPYHHGKKKLEPMELEKRKAFHSFKTDYGLDVESIVDSVSNILVQLLGSYDKLEEELTQNPSKFLEIMIVDGCFMLQFFIDCPTSLRNMSGDIRRDMLLLENQLPMKLLDQLHFMANEKQQQSKDLTSLIRDSFCMPGEVGQPDHILDMYRASLLYPDLDLKDRREKDNRKKLSDPEYQIIRPATQLREAGIKFESSETKSLTDVKFCPNRGLLNVPQLVVDDNTESAFLNVMAFEKLHVVAGSKVSSFIVLMNNLIDEDRDVALLASKKVLLNALGNDHDAANLFNRLGNGVALDLSSAMMEVHKLVNVHCNKPWNEWCASLKHNYFQNPWAIISILAAILGFVLLILQAAYQLFDYYLKV